MAEDGVDRASAGLAQFGFSKLIVGDLEAAAAFYRAVFGLVDWQRVTKDRSATTGGPIDEINFRPATPGAAALTLLQLVDRPPPPRGETVLGFITHDLATVLARAVAHGGRIATPIEAQPEHRIQVAFIEDPEGHLIEIVQMD